MSLVATIATLTIVYATPPCGRRDWWGCYDPAHRRIELANRDPHSREHEIGHAFDHQTMTAADREWFRIAFAMPTWDAEAFADLYATCSTRGLIPRGRGRVVTGRYGYSYPLAKYRQMCRRLRYYTEGLRWRP